MKRRYSLETNVRSSLLRAGLFGAVTVGSGAALTQPASADFFLNSNGTNQVFRFEENTGELLQELPQVQGPYAAQIGYNGDYFVSGNTLGEIARYDSKTGARLQDLVLPGGGGLQRPTAPNFGPDGKFYVGDLATNSILKYDQYGNFIKVFTNKALSGLDTPFMQTFDDRYQYQTSFATNSILKYDVFTEEFLGAFATPNSGGLVGPVGLEFGPDGHLYTSSSGTNEVLRYDGKTGAFIDAFVPAGYGGISSPRAIRFGGTNSDLYVVNWNSNSILKYDRVDGHFIGTVVNLHTHGVVGPRGLTFSPRPAFNVRAEPAVIPPSHNHGWVNVNIAQVILYDFSDPSPKVSLDSITVNDPSCNTKKEIKDAKFGTKDYAFRIRANHTCSDRVYTVTYHATNKLGVPVIATTTVTLKAKPNLCSNDAADWDSIDQLAASEAETE